MKKMLGLAVAALVCVICFSSCGKKMRLHPLRRWQENLFNY